MEIERVRSRVPDPVKKNAPAPSSPVLELSDLYCILQIQPNDSVIAMELARRMTEAGRHQDAARVLRGVLSIDDGFETRARLGKAEYLIDQLDAAFAHLQQALLVAPEAGELLFEVHKTLGNIFVRQGDFELAQDSYHRAHRLNADSDDLYVNLGTLAVQRQDWDGAVEKFRHALLLNSANDKAWAGLAIGHHMKGDRELAWGNIETALQYNPLNEVALTLALDWGVADKREFHVLELVRRFLIEGGWNEKFSLAFIWLSYRRGERLQAALELERLLAVNPSHEFGLSLAKEMRAEL